MTRFPGHDAEIRSRITEQLEERIRKRVRYDGKTEPESYRLPTGRLRITLQLGYREGPTFEDSESKQLESQLNRLYVSVYRLVVKSWESDRKERESQRRYEEEQQRRAEAARLRAEQERKTAEERRRGQALITEANRWADARVLREYLAHVLSASGDGDCAEWLAWAQRVADDLDPTAARLSKRPPD